MSAFDPKTLYARQPELIAVDMDGETVMMSIENGTYYGLGGVGSRMWQLLESPINLDAIVEVICREFDINLETCAEDAQQFLADLLAHELIVGR